MSPEGKEVITRKEARKRGLTRYFTGKICPKGHVAERRTCSSVCVTCDRNNVKSRQRRGGSKYSVTRARLNKNRKLRKCTDPSYKLALNIRNRLRMAIRGSYRSGSAVRDLGCTIPQLRDYLSERFAPEMSWENYGSWHIDHVRPLASFDLRNRPQFLTAVHYTNLQPLWAADNIAKGTAI